MALSLVLFARAQPRSLAQPSLAPSLSSFRDAQVLFVDLRQAAVHDLYAPTVAEGRIGPLLDALGPQLKAVVRAVAPPLRDAAVSSLLRATLLALRRALLDGGPTRAFTVADSGLFDEDLVLLKELFEADGEGLPREAVRAACAPYQQLLVLSGLETELLIAHYETARQRAAALASAPSALARSASGPSGAFPIGPYAAASAAAAAKGGPVAMEPEAVLKMVCHRADRAASKYLKVKARLMGTSLRERGVAG